MAKPHQRFFALLIAVLFFATSVATGVIVLWQINQENKIASNASLGGDDNLNTLEGTKLAGFNPVAEVKELQAIDLQAGDGEEVKPGATVTAHYTGALAKDGTIFQSSHDMGDPVAFNLDGVIEGWAEGVPGMKVGGTRRLLIPYGQAYGEAGSPPSIPPRADLVFDIELIAVENP